MSSSSLTAVQCAFRDLLSLAREQHDGARWGGATQQRFARLLGWSQSALSTREAGKRPIRLVHIAAVCDVTGRDLAVSLAGIARASVVPGYAAMRPWDRAQVLARSIAEMGLHVGQQELLEQEEAP